MRNNKYYLVTGVAGFIGSSLANKLLLKNKIVIGIDNLSSGNINNIPKGVIFIRGDCSKIKIIKQISNYKFEAIYHFAGQSSGEISFEDPIKDIRSNVLTTINLLQFCKINKCKKFIYASSMSVYGLKKTKADELSKLEPVSFYAIGKIASENYIKLFSSKQVNFTILRLFNVYGPAQDLKNLKQGMVSIYLSQFLQSNKVIVKGSPDRYRDFVYIDDVTNICIDVLKSKKNYEIFNVCTGMKTSVKELLLKIKKFTKSNNEIIYKDSTPGDQFGIFGNNSKLLNFDKKYKFIDLNIGLKKTINWAINKRKFKETF